MNRLRQLCAALATVSVAMAATSCATHTPQEVNDEWRDVIAQRLDQYRIKDGDNLEITLYEYEGALSEQAGLVLPDGRTDLFFMRSHKVLGKSVEEFEAEFQEAISSEIEGIEASVQVTPRQEWVYMTGRWERATKVELTRNMTLREAIASVDGDSLTGRPWKVLLRRPYRNPLRPEIYYVSIWDETEEIMLLPGDIIENDYNIVAYVIAIVREYIFGVIPSQWYSGAFAAGALF